MDADLQFPLHIHQLFPDLRVEYPEKIGDRETYVLFCQREGRLAAKLYFDPQSGLLVRLVHFSDSPLGVNPSQADYSDYRDVDSVQVPFRVTVSVPGSTSTVRIIEVRQNIPIDAARFVKPPAEGPSASSAPSH
jgi:hypothetical protein